MNAKTIFTQQANRWLPAPEARGPWPGQHGGAVAGLMAAELEKFAATQRLGQGQSLTVYFLRPAPLAPVAVSVEPMRLGGRVATLSAEAVIEGKVCAVAQAVFVQPQPISTLPKVELTAVHTPEAAAPYDIGHYTDDRWYFNALALRRAADGIFWLRPILPVVQPLSPLALVASIADTASGVSRVDRVAEPLVAALPNAELAVHLARQPRSEWVGLQPQSTWYANGMGLTDTALYDIYGYIGRACHTLVLLPKSE